MIKDSYRTLLAQLKNPFEPKLVKFRPGGGKQLAYIDARDVMKRLDDVLGAENYQTKFIPVDGGFVCELSLKLGDEWITRSDGANNTKVEPLKGGISGALKRAANAWGIGRYLYYMPSTCNANNVSSWPKWALPNNKIENWEDIAEMEAEIDSGMDEEEVVANTIGVLEKINAAQTKEELKEVVKSLDSSAQAIFANQIENRTQEILGGNSEPQA
jgi:hypothetical protein